MTASIGCMYVKYVFEKHYSCIWYARGGKDRNVACEKDPHAAESCIYQMIEKNDAANIAEPRPAVS